MIFEPVAIAGAFLLKLDLLTDERGFFARTFCEEEFRLHKLNPHIAQTSLAYNARKGTLRGLHYQIAPHEEEKIVRCTRGKIYDVIVDLRRDSPTYRKWHGVELSAENRLALYVPKGVAHGFQTLEEHSEVLYQISQMYQPTAAKGVRWNDPVFAIRWPLTDLAFLSHRDRTYPDFQDPDR